MQRFSSSLTYDPYEMLQHLPGLFATLVGRLSDCPDAVNTAWIRLVTPREDDTNRSRWDTDALWRVDQSPTFADVPVAARRMIRRKQRAHPQCTRLLNTFTVWRAKLEDTALDAQAAPGVCRNTLIPGPCTCCHAN